MEIKFEDLEKECKPCAEGLREQLELLPIFLNSFPEMQLSWLYDMDLTSSEIEKIKSITDEYAKRKIKYENENPPKTKEQVIAIEDKVLKEMYEARTLRATHLKGEFITAYLHSCFPDGLILQPGQLEKLEQLTWFTEHNKKFPFGYLIFNPKNNKIIGYEVITK